MQIAVLFLMAFIIYVLQDKLYEKVFNRAYAIDVALSFSAGRAFEGDTLFMTEVITNRKYLPLPWVSVKLQMPRSLEFTDSENSSVTDDYYRNDLFSILMYQRITRRAEFVCAKRGFYRIKTIDLVTSNIFVTRKFASIREANLELLVYPRLIDITTLDIPFKRIIGSIVAKRFINPDPFEFRGIREYQTYDSFSQINFKQSAKSGELMVNLHDHTISQEIVIFLNLQKYSSWSSEFLFEYAISLSASLATYYIDMGVPVSFIHNGGVIEKGSGSGHTENIYETLARIEFDGDFAPISGIIDDYGQDTEPTYLLISTYHEKDLQESFDKIKENGNDCMWIIPIDESINVKHLLSEDIYSVEVEL